MRRVQDFSEKLASFTLEEGGGCSIFVVGEVGKGIQLFGKSSPLISPLTSEHLNNLYHDDLEHTLHSFTILQPWQKHDILDWL